MKAKILVVDDEKSIRVTFDAFLSEGGYDAVTVADYNEALTTMETWNPDVIFSDIVLGGKTGIDLLQEVRKRKMNCPMVMITGAPDIETASEAVRLGAFDYIPKPVEQEKLLQAAKVALRHKRVLDENEQYRSHLEAIFSSVQEGILMVDKELVVAEINDAARNLCGFLDRNVTGKPLNSLPIFFNQRALELLQETLRNKKPQEIHRFECQHPDGHIKVMTLTASPLFDNQKKLCGAVLVIRDETRLDDLERGFRERTQFHDLIGRTPVMQKLYTLLEDLADVQTTVLITGESGTGKELVAEALHHSGVRRSMPLVKVNCSALPEGLLESELFGHVKGAFTGAVRDKVGRFQRAHGGTILLDEIGDLSPLMQLRLLRVLQEMEFERVGDSAPIKVDVRVVAATNRDLQEKVRSGEFREDLYYRLKVVEVTLPPLRDRRDDIPFLTEHFLQKFNKKFGKKIMSLSDDARSIIAEHTWPGNVRELEHSLEHAFVLCRQNTITVEHLPTYFRDLSLQDPFVSGHKGVEGPQDILEALEKSDGNKTAAARMLGISRMTLYRKIEEYNIFDER